MFSQMGGQRLSTHSSGEIPLEAIMKDGVRSQPDVAAFASLEGRRLSIMVWHYHDDDLHGPDAAVELTAAGLGNATSASLTHYRIDDTHSNSYAEWKRLGSPIAPNDEQYVQLEKAGKLAELAPAEAVRIEGGKATLKFTLPRQGVSLLVLELPGTN
jgi:xylan 1,4-beta-xylosidase